MKKALFTFLLFLSLISGFTQTEGYEIEISLKGYQDSIGYLGHYYGDKLTVQDTATIDKGLILPPTVAGQVNIALIGPSVNFSYIKTLTSSRWPGYN